MPKQAYEVYVSTFRTAVEALQAGDEVRLQAMCREVASRSGIASTVSLMAVSDAECGRPPRTQAGIRGMFWQNWSVDGDPPFRGGAPRAGPGAGPKAAA